MLADPARRREMGATAYANFRASFSEDVVVPRYFDLVERLRTRHAVAPPPRMHAAPVHV
jgi:hypothetical protein